ncbi:hypothetical protein POM88_040327 [Heracleum sosnowskyi]|uniref:YDG domain-containing protein n=1 Tax=Heracleum sosnowskyi TaxID=360622 RepID=A0AAD8HDX0_9APIA|nr:hypothetical protein POM88_040327 [Heracleum sosnowskyi]
MENNNDGDANRQMVIHVLETFVFHRHVEGLSPMTAYNAVPRDEKIGPNVETMISRARTLGHVPGVHIGDDFFYRQEIRLVGLHRDMIRGISTTLYDDGVEIGACVVANYEDHNVVIEDDLYCYGSDGGNLILAHRLHLRVLNNQELENGNYAMVNSIEVANPIRLLGRNLMEDGTRRYVFVGLFKVLFHAIIQSDNEFDVFEFFS